MKERSGGDLQRKRVYIVPVQVHGARTSRNLQLPANVSGKLSVSVRTRCFDDDGNLQARDVTDVQQLRLAAATRQADPGRDANKANRTLTLKGAKRRPSSELHLPPFIPQPPGVFLFSASFGRPSF
ncbi:hypothetical protein CIHG_03681 [Coccidioides immitis H538.4]|uniref:Uncharacterized protein n=1 Tax=Coccidioides immitis H538.4 TaxID=396776 RepID=A0A0J8RM14_COCIT|nr:hypothetical protein CIHG_03681 [Coccidioides immitis H538.4]